MRVLIVTALAVAACAGTVDGADRTYYVQANEVDWDYVPTDQNLIHCTPLANDEFASVFTHSGNGYIGKACLAILPGLSHPYSGRHPQQQRAISPTA